MRASALNTPRFRIVTFAGVLVAGLLAAGSNPALADRGDHRGDRGHRDGGKATVSISKTFRGDNGHARVAVKAGNHGTRITFRGVAYDYDNYGRFYRFDRGHRYVVNAPVGSVVRALPRYAQVTYVRGKPFYVANGTFYRWVPRRHGYVVVNPPRGAFIQHLPRGHRVVWKNGRRYYNHGGVYYQDFRNGRTAGYAVVRF